MTSYTIPFNKPYLSGNETDYITQAVNSGKISGNGVFTKKCQRFLESRYGFGRSLLTTSCTDALEMAAILADIQPGDEVIVPAYTFVSTALAFVRQGAKIVFADSRSDHPNLDVGQLDALITPRTKAIVPVHYAGTACDMDVLLHLADRHNLLIIEDAAQAVDGYYNGRALGSIGHLSAFSFHETKNIIAGEGGMLAVNDIRFNRRAEIIWEKGTNRSEFFRGEIDKYGWVDTGSSLLPSEVISAFLYAQLESLDAIQQRRVQLWQYYLDALRPLAEDGQFGLPFVPSYASNNAHIFYLICPSLAKRDQLISTLKAEGILAVFHYQSLHRSAYYCEKHDGRDLPFADMYSDCLIRLPLFYELTFAEIDRIVQAIYRVFARVRNAHAVHYHH